jgi:hypothetical protein
MTYQNSLVPASQVYSLWPSYEVTNIYFSRGQATLEIIVYDTKGNSKIATFKLQVN